MAGKINNILEKCTSGSLVNIANDEYSVTGAPFTPNTAFSQTITADSNYVFKTPPSIFFDDVEFPGDYSVTVTDTGSIANNNLTARQFSIVYKPRTKKPIGDVITFEAKAEENFTASTNNIYAYRMDKSPLNNLGETRVIQVFGDPGAKYTIDIDNETSGYGGQDISGGAIVQTIPQSGVHEYRLIIPGLKYWNGDIATGASLYDQQIKIVFGTSGGSTLHFLDTTVYLNQYRNTNVYLNISKGASAVAWQIAGGTAITSNEDLWTRSNTSVNGWSTTGGIAVGGFNNQVQITNSSGSITVQENTSLKTLCSGTTPDFVVGDTYEMTFNAKTTSNSGRIDFQIRSSSASRLVIVSSTGDTSNYRAVKMQFTPTTTDCKFFVGGSETNGKLQVGQVVSVKDFVVKKLKTNASAVLTAKAGSEEGTSYDFKFDVYLPTANKKIKYNTYTASGSQRDSYANDASVSGDIAANENITIINPSNFDAWRKNNTVAKQGSLKNNVSTTMEYANGCVASVGGINALTTYGTTTDKAKLTITGNLQIIKYPTGNDAVIEFCLPSWFDQSTNSF